MLIHWIWFATRTGMGDKTKAVLLSHFEDPEAIYFAPELEFERFGDLSGSAVESMMDKDLTECEQILAQCQEKGIHILTFRDAAYPNRLKNIPDPPMVLYYRGTLPSLDELPVIGVVGTRKASVYGLTTAKRLGYQIAACGGMVVSGGAAGIDPMALEGALAAGIEVGVYFFTQAINEVEAVEEASMVLSLIRNYSISYPVFIDTERANGRADGLDAATRTAVCRAFCETIRNAGYSAGVYASKYWYYDNLNYSSLSGYNIWLAQYASEPTFNHRYDLWQYTENGTVNGVSGHVDMNISYLGY